MKEVMMNMMMLNLETDFGLELMEQVLHFMMISDMKILMSMNF